MPSPHFGHARGRRLLLGRAGGGLLVLLVVFLGISLLLIFLIFFFSLWSSRCTSSCNFTTVFFGEFQNIFSFKLLNKLFNFCTVGFGT